MNIIVVSLIAVLLTLSPTNGHRHVPGPGSSEIIRPRVSTDNSKRSTTIAVNGSGSESVRAGRAKMLIVFSGGRFEKSQDAMAEGMRLSEALQAVMRQASGVQDAYFGGKWGSTLTAKDAYRSEIEWICEISGEPGADRSAQDSARGLLNSEGIEIERMLDTPTTLQRLATRQAFSEALAKARSIADAAGLWLGDPVSIREVLITDNLPKPMNSATQWSDEDSNQEERWTVRVNIEVVFHAEPKQ